MKNGDYILVKAPEDFPGYKYRGKYCYEHHLVYWEENGVVPEDNQIIHHKNGNKFDNSIENLELLDRSTHSSMHGKEE